MNDENSTIVAQEVLEYEKKHKEALQILLDREKDRKGHQLALTTHMGMNRSYLLSVPMRWVAQNVRFASELPVFKDHKKDHKEDIAPINAHTMEFIQQRRPDWRRQIPMTTYLVTRKYRKFPTLLLVAYQDWTYDKNSEKWGPHGEAMEETINAQPLDSNTAYVSLDIGGTSYFALDGQHRLMGIKGLHDLLDGRLSKKKEDGTVTSTNNITLDELRDFCEKKRVKLPNNIDSIMDEQIGLEIMPAVMQGETLTGAISRLRNVFVDVNQNARRLEKGELALLDENNGFSILAREMMVSHLLFEGEKRVEAKSAQLNEKSEKYTTLQSLVEIAYEYLSQFYVYEFIQWKDEILDIKGAGLWRPTDEDLKKGREQLEEYFDEIGKLPSHKEMIQGEPVSYLRGKKWRDREGRDHEGRDHVLFRPIAQMALAEAVGQLQNNDEYNKLTLPVIMQRLASRDKKDSMDLRLTVPESPWFGLLCDPVNKTVRRHKKYQELCNLMFVYLLGGGLKDDQGREALKDEFFEARRITVDGDDNPKAINLEGKPVTKDNFYLPNPWT